ncbi:MAG: hypothetical protein FJ399_17840 [Verrucomicrobia bacterium]|nr:hypothetical protein [Verrucomicrobiota bacterium]
MKAIAYLTFLVASAISSLAAPNWQSIEFSLTEAVSAGSIRTAPVILKADNTWTAANNKGLLMETSGKWNAIKIGASPVVVCVGKAPGSQMVKLDKCDLARVAVKDQDHGDAKPGKDEVVTIAWVCTKLTP